MLAVAASGDEHSTATDAAVWDPDAPHSASATGWRLWVFDPNASEPVLFPPYAPAAGWVAKRVVVAGCVFDDNHVPPVASCRCGVRAVPNVIAAMFRLRVFSANIAISYRSESPARTVIPVLARVHLTAVRWDHRSPDGSLKLISPEMRAGIAEIQALYVNYPIADFAATQHFDRRLGNYPVADPLLMLRVAERLRGAFGVPVVVGLPDYTLADWRTMPYWFRVGGTPELSWDYGTLRDRGRAIGFSGVAPRPGVAINGSHIDFREVSDSGQADASW